MGSKRSTYFRMPVIIYKYNQVKETDGRQAEYLFPGVSRTTETSIEALGSDNKLTAADVSSVVQHLSHLMVILSILGALLMTYLRNSISRTFPLNF